MMLRSVQSLCNVMSEEVKTFANQGDEPMCDAVFVQERQSLRRHQNTSHFSTYRWDILTSNVCSMKSTTSLT